MTEIVAIKKSSIEDRSNVLVDLWVANENGGSPSTSRKFFALSGSKTLTSRVEEIIDSSQQYLLISTAFMDNTFSAALDRAGDRGV